ncbi:hypothetical protein [Glaciecola sp. 1036]|uniref:hypothetical protein n=1 Tax=Alteromonadaceae TaxID=72275 RepID=UPI003D0019A3
MTKAVNRILRRTIVLCAFFVVFACSQQVEESSPETLNPSETPAQPLLTLSELLSATDVKDGLASAAETNDQMLLKQWQDRLLQAADEVYLLESEKKLLEGEQGIIFLSFQGMKVNYQRDFEQAFFNFGDVEQVYLDYPAFESLHGKSQDLVEQRDNLISNATEKLKQNGFQGDAEAEAKRQWQQLMQQAQQN